MKILTLADLADLAEIIFKRGLEKSLADHADPAEMVFSGLTISRVISSDLGSSRVIHGD